MDPSITTRRKWSVLGAGVAALTLVAAALSTSAQSADASIGGAAHGVLDQKLSVAQGQLTTAPTIPAKLECAALVQNPAPNTLVPDFTQIPGAPTRIQSAKVVGATTDQPEYCDVQGYIDSQIKFQLKLPTETWQGRYLQFGCGGFCGSISDTTFPACRTDLGGDFAIAATNDGHDAAGTDALWAGTSRRARVDFGYRAVHMLSVAAKKIQKAYYGVGPRWSYFSGCSDGGREGLIEAQYYPGDFDGILAGAPANGMSTVPLWLAAGVRANTDSAGDPILTTDKLEPLHDAVVAECDANDSVIGDGLIGDPRLCDFDPASIECEGPDQPTCLTAAEVSVIRSLYRGAVDKQGTVLDPRRSPKGSELSWDGWWVPLPPRDGTPEGTPMRSTARDFGESAARWLSYPIGAGKPLSSVRFTTREFKTLSKQSRIYESMNINLKPFRNQGGKLMMYQGMADVLVPPSHILEWYSETRDFMGGQRAIDSFSRLFMVNGMGHCGGGPTPDTSAMILQLVQWVEGGVAPSSILARDEVDGSNRVRPVYAYPRVPKYVGPDPAQDPEGLNDPENFVPTRPALKLKDDVKWVGDSLLRRYPVRD